MQRGHVLLLDDPIDLDGIFGFLAIQGIEQDTGARRSKTTPSAFIPLLGY